MRAQLTFKDFPLLNEVMFMVIVDEYSIYMDTVLWHTILLDVRCSESQLSFTSNIVHFVLSSASPRNVIIPTPPHPTPRETSRVRSIKHVCKCKVRHHPHPTPPHPTPRETSRVRSIKHVCKCKVRHHPHPTPPHPTPIETSRVRSIKHVCKCKVRHHPHPTPPHPEKHPVCVASNLCASARYVIKHVFKWKKHHQSKKQTSRGRWVGVYPTTTTRRSNKKQQQ